MNQIVLKMSQSYFWEYATLKWKRTLMQLCFPEILASAKRIVACMPHPLTTNPGL